MYFPVLLWSLVIFASFWGYGEALRRAIKRPEFDDLGWGLTAAWGMAVTLAIGGFLMMFSLAKAPMLTGVVLAGSALALYFFAQRLTRAITTQPASKKSKSKKGKAAEEINSRPTQAKHAGYPEVIANILLWTLAALAFASSIAWPIQIDPNDDLICYLMLPEKILHTGTLIEPFNLRRAGTLGGHAFLQALVMVVGEDRSGHVADLGFGKLLLFGVAMGFIKGNGRTQTIQRILIGVFVLLFPVPRINTMSAYTGSALLLALMRTVTLIPAAKKTPPLWTWLPAWLLCAACATLRPQFGLVAGMVLTVAWAANFYDGWKQKLPGIWTTFVILIPPALFALPWMFVLFQSNETFFLPPWYGNVNPVFLINTNADLANVGAVIMRFFSRHEVLPVVLLGLLALLGPRSLIGIFFMLACFAASVAVAYKMSATMPVEMPRYIVPMLLPGAIFALCVINWSRPAIGILASAACVASLALNAPFIWEESKFRVSSLPGQVAGYVPLHPDDLNNPGAYLSGLRALQEKVPAGKKILSVIDFPYLLDFSRNDIVCVDTIGAAGPGGGLPFGKGADALNNYLKENGMEYVITMDFNNALLLYNRNYWMNHPRPEWYYKKVWVPRFLDFMDNLDQLSSSNSNVEKFHNMLVFKLK
jgi:hypothetical protein